jgi:hypothetical protein
VLVDVEYLAGLTAHFDLNKTKANGLISPAHFGGQHPPFAEQDPQFQSKAGQFRASPRVTMATRSKS